MSDTLCVFTNAPELAAQVQAWAGDGGSPLGVRTFSGKNLPIERRTDLLLFQHSGAKSALRSFRNFRSKLNPCYCLILFDRAPGKELSAFLEAGADDYVIGKEPEYLHAGLQAWQFRRQQACREEDHLTSDFAAWQSPLPAIIRMNSAGEVTGFSPSAAEMLRLPSRMPLPCSRETLFRASQIPGLPEILAREGLLPPPQAGLKPHEVFIPPPSEDHNSIWLNFQHFRTSPRTGSDTIEVISDASPKRRVMRALQESEERFRGVFKESSMGMVIILPDQNLMQVNSAFGNMLRIPLEELKGKPYVELLHEDDRNITRKKFRQLLSGSSIHFKLEKRFNKPDGSIMWANVSTTLIHTNDGKPLYFIGVIEDISQRRRAEQELVRYMERLFIFNFLQRDILAARSSDEISESALERLGELVPYDYASVILADDDHNSARLTALKKRGKLLLKPYKKLSYEELAFFTTRGFENYDYITDLSLAGPLSEHLQELSAQGIRSVVRIPMIAKHQMIGRLNIASKNVEGMDSQDIRIAREIADVLAVGIQQSRLYEKLAREAERLEIRVSERTAELQALNLELESFAYSVSHDLRAPLRAVLGFAEILVERHSGAMPDEGRHYLSNIVTAGHQMNALIEDLLKFARIRRDLVDTRPIEMRKVLATIISNMNQRLEAIGGEISMTGHNPIVSGDKTLIHQIFTNLLENALKYRQPEIRLRVEIHLAVTGNSAIITVRDNGIGIQPKYHDIIFNVFQRLHSQEQYPGTGIGLALARKAADLMGGTIAVESTPGKGSAFLVTLLLAKTEENENRRTG